MEEGFRLSSADSLSAQFHYDNFIHTKLKRKNIVQIPILCFTTALQHSSSGRRGVEVADSLVAVVTVYNKFKGIGYIQVYFFNSHTVKRASSL